MHAGRKGAVEIYREKEEGKEALKLKKKRKGKELSGGRDRFGFWDHKCETARELKGPTRKAARLPSLN